MEFRCDLDRTAHEPDPLVDADEPEPHTLAARPGDVESTAIVVDGEFHAVIDANQPNACGRRPGVPNDVAQRFLDDAIHTESGGGIEVVEPSLRPEPHSDGLLALH